MSRHCCASAAFKTVSNVWDRDHFADVTKMVERKSLAQPETLDGEEKL